MKTLVYTCDVCGKQKGEANHWFMARGSCVYATSPYFERWSGSAGADFHLCGQECCHKLLDKWLQGRRECA